MGEISLFLSRSSPHSVGAEEIRLREALNFSEFLSGKLACVAGRLLAYSKRLFPTNEN